MSPAINSTRRRSKSLCEKSCEIAATLAKVSSLYLATRTLPQNRVSNRLIKDRPTAAVQQNDGPRQLVAEQESRPAAYVMEPVEGVDALAEEYIRGSRGRFERHVDEHVRYEASKCAPPPPMKEWAAGSGYHEVSKGIFQLPPPPPPSKNKWAAGSSYHRRY
ncbi:hypothetical protein HPP92_011355 [Vanilla planifolia]|uniref:Uncharacterized protein n=1 Tax=Vanilla planifolia TaxID=51239 RepID=A0A835R5W0_VANPL|nr:hypothetical protein HPP92_011355 [Vanilla planifolia]